MKKQDLLKMIDDELLEKLYGFCYARTSDSYQAQELCSDIIFALVKAGHTEGNIEQPYPFIWRVARNVYADFSCQRKRYADHIYEGEADEVIAMLVQEEAEEEISDAERLLTVYRQIAFLTKAYREVMILYYLDGLSTQEIARQQNTSEGAIRQRLFSARKKIKSEVEDMEKTKGQKPVALDHIEYILWGMGDTNWDDPRNVCNRQFSKHILWLCRKKPRSATEIAAELHVPTLYVEEELALLAYGEKGNYGLLRKLENQKYALNFLLLDCETMDRANAMYAEQLPMIVDTVIDYIEKHKEEYLLFPYLNKRVDLNLILWQQITVLKGAFEKQVEKILETQYFTQVKEHKRPFTVYGYVDNGKRFGHGWDGVTAKNVCGFSKIYIENIYINRIAPHFHCGLNIATDEKVQLALRAINGISINTLSEAEQEHAAKAISCGYLYRERDTLYTKILVYDLKDKERLFKISEDLTQGYLEVEAQQVAKRLFELINKCIPSHLLGEWRCANILAGLPMLDLLVEHLIEKDILIPPQIPLGPEGCWMGIGHEEGLTC